MNTNSRTVRTVRGLVTGVGVGIIAFALAGCSAGATTEAESSPKPTATSAAKPTATPSATATPTAPAVATVSGYDVGQFPPVPLFRLPDLSLLDTSASSFTIDVQRDFSNIPGVTVTAAP